VKSLIAAACKHAREQSMSGRPSVTESETRAVGALRKKVQNRSILSRWSLEPSWPAYSREDTEAVERIESMLPSLIGQVVNVDGIAVPIGPHVTPYILYLLLNNAYEVGDLRLVRKHVRHGHRGLVLGCGLGVIATCIARLSKMPVATVDANRTLAAPIATIAQLNGVELQFICGAVVGGEARGTVSFAVADEFWSSSLNLRDSGRIQRKVDVPILDMESVMASMRPTVLFVDIEGAEEQLFRSYAFPVDVELVFVEIHRPNMGPGRAARAMNDMWHQGYKLIDMDGLTTVWRR